MFAPRASDVDFVSVVHCVNDVTPYGVVGKHHITASICEQHHYAQHNITFALAKTSLTEKEQTYKIFVLRVCSFCV